MTKIFSFFILFYPFFLFGQSVDSTKIKKWLAEITRNAQNKNVGYSLYFAKVDTLEVPYLVYLPKSYDPLKPMKLMVYLHGGIASLADFEYKDPEFVEEPIFTLSDKYNFMVLFPFGKKSFGWLNQPQAFENILSIIKKTETLYNINSKQIFIGGMSNGGSATFWFINKPQIFAGFYAFSPFPELKVSNINFKNITAKKPLYSVNAKDDSLYNYQKVKSLYDLHKMESPGWHFDTLENGGHGFIYNANGVEIMENTIRALLNSK